MARILLGVSGGIAAYRALELARLATNAGHGVRVAMTPVASASSGPPRSRASWGRRCWAMSSSAIRCAARFRGIRCRPTTRSATSAVVSNADVYLIAPASANTIAKLAAGIADSHGHHVFFGLHRAACGRPGDERPDVSRTRPRRRTWRRCASAASGSSTPRRAPSRRGASTAWEGWPRQSACWKKSRRSRTRAGLVGRASGPGDGRRDPRADRLRALHRQPLERSHGARAGRPSGTARRGSDAGRRQRVTPRGPRGSPHRRRDHE